MKLVLLFGNAAVGKMTVGQALMKMTDLRLCHNHITIEPVIEVFGHYDGRITERLREVIFEEFVKSDQYGMIFTFMWAFDHPSDWENVANICKTFEGADIYYIELVADKEARMARNVTENRILHKASKRDIEASNQRVINDDQRFRCESLPGEITFPNYLRIDNTNLSPEEAAQLIKDTFDL